ncbi:MAG: DUF1206 domain-containing protein [Chloroflexi bacterium]|nr:DUF1206 domain-containing protein [Chloroflexota bacterium]
MHAPAATAPRTQGPLDDVGRGIEAGARATRPGIEILGRLGYAAKGAVYILIGVLAVQAAVGEGGQATDQAGALTRIASLPFGKAILGLLIVGLIGYALWRTAQAAMDTEHQGSDAKGLLTRALCLGIAGTYGGLALSALKLLTSGQASASSSEKTQGWTTWLMDQPFGIWLVGLVGAAIVANGLAQFYRAYKSSLTDDLHLTDVGAQHADLVTKIGRAGYAARGVAFVMIGGFLVGAAMHHNPSEAQGLDGILATLVAQPFGPYLLGVVAIGLAAYGVFALVEARYRRMVIL